MAEFYKDKKEEPNEDKKKIEPIEDFGTLWATYEFENERYQHTKDRDYDAIVPARHHLLGGPDPKNIGTLNELRNHLRLSKIKELTIGHKMIDIMREIEEVTNQDEIHIELLEEHVDHYQFLCESAAKIIDNLYGDIEKLKTQVGEKEQHITDLTTEPEEIIIPPSEEKKRELQEIYNNLQNSLQFALLVNPKRDGKNLTPGERAYLKEVNKELQKFKGTRRKEPVGNKSVKTTKEFTNIPKEPSEPPVYSPLSPKSKNQIPLKEEEKPKNSNQ